MNDAIDRLAEVGAATVRVDAGRWTPDSALDELAKALKFPDHFGRNMDALADCLFEVVSGEYGFAGTATRRVLAIYQFEAFAIGFPERSAMLVSALYESAIVALKLGAPFLVLLQSDDPDLHLAPVGATMIGWNRAEFQRSRRS